MHELLIYRKKYDRLDTVEDFIDLYYSSEMHHFASDLIEKGLSPNHIRDAVRSAMTACRNSGEEVRRHFSPVYTDQGGMVINDCKLSKLGHRLVLMNADPKLPYIARWQMKAAQGYFR